MMHGNTKIKFVNAKQAKTYYNYKVPVNPYSTSLGCRE
jgi:hypothetical protein